MQELRSEDISEDKTIISPQVLFRAYFSEGQNIADEGVLRSLVKEVGLDDGRAMAALHDTEAIQKYEEEVKEATRKGENSLQKLFGALRNTFFSGITGVPHFEIYRTDRPGMRQAVSGAQPINTFVALFNRLRVLPKV